MRVASFGLLLSFLVHGSLSGQQAPRQLFEETGPVAASTSDLLSGIVTADLKRSSAVATRPLLRSALVVGGFALVGTGIGYFFSHVAYNDWDKETNSTFVRERRLFALAGAGAGVFSGVLFGLHENAVQGGPVPVRQDLGREFITQLELERVSTPDLYSALRALRPEWLTIRGTSSIQEGGLSRSTGSSPRDFVILEGAPTIRVYVDNAYFGEASALSQVPVATVSRVTHLDSADATMRFGAGHLHGAIVVETVSSG